MQPVTVVKANNLVRNIVCRLGVIVIVFMPYPLHFQIQEETFHDSVIPSVTFAAHAAYQVILLQQRLMFSAGVLRSPVGMDDQPWCWVSLNNGHL